MISNTFIKNQTYIWAQILAGTGGVSGPVFYLLHDKGTQNVVAACLKIETNPRAPYEIIPDNGPAIAQWADHLSTQTVPIAAFVQELDGNWYYRGQFKVIGRSSDANEIRLREMQANRADVYKVIFLQEV